jgi:hypothetical protein
MYRLHHIYLKIVNFGRIKEKTFISFNFKPMIWEKSSEIYSSTFALFAQCFCFPIPHDYVLFTCRMKNLVHTFFFIKFFFFGYTTLLTLVLHSTHYLSLILSRSICLSLGICSILLRRNQSILTQKKLNFYTFQTYYVLRNHSSSSLILFISFYLLKSNSY